MGMDASSHSSPSPSQKRIFPEGFALAARYQHLNTTSSLVANFLTTGPIR